MPFFLGWGNLFLEDKRIFSMVRSRKKRGGKLRKKRFLARRHARERFGERAGLRLNPEREKAVLKQIWEQKSYPVQLESVQKPGRSVHLVEVEGKAYQVVYDRISKTLVTVFPRVQLKEGRRFKKRLKRRKGPG